MGAEARRIRTAVQRHQKLRTDTGTRYPAQLRQQVLAYSAHMGRGGESVQSIARDLGLRPQLLAYWLKRSSGIRMRPVEIDRAEEPAIVPADKREFVLVTPSGVKVEGLDLTALTHLLRALS
ncbi:MAG: hypothetical protein ACREXQ_06180 [Polaromonas sp.]